MSVKVRHETESLQIAHNLKSAEHPHWPNEAVERRPFCTTAKTTGSEREREENKLETLPNPT